MGQSRTKIYLNITWSSLLRRIVHHALRDNSWQRKSVILFNATPLKCLHQRGRSCRAFLPIVCVLFKIILQSTYIVLKYISKYICANNTRSRQSCSTLPAIDANQNTIHFSIATQVKFHWTCTYETIIFVMETHLCTKRSFSFLHSPHSCKRSPHHIKRIQHTDD